MYSKYAHVRGAGQNPTANYTTQQDFSSEITYLYLSILWNAEFEPAIRISLARLVFLNQIFIFFNSIVLHRY